jgi:enoyl-CoA hydratase/carnithine racemase
MAATRGKHHDEGLALEADLFAQSFGLPDQREGMAAFVEKRQAVFESGQPE